MNGYTTPWTDERTNKLVELTDEGLTATQVGQKLGVTKNSVIGKWYRLAINVEERNRRRAKAEREAEVEREKFQIREAARRMKRQRQPGLCIIEGCTLTAAGGYLDGRCPKHRIALMPDRTRANMAANKGPVGW